MSLSYETPLYQVIKGLKLSSPVPVPRKATRRRTTRRRTTKRRTTAGSGSRSGIAHMDPDPAKSYGSGSATLM